MTTYNGFNSWASAMRAIRAAGFNFSSALGATESNPKLTKGEKIGVLSAPHNLAPASESGFNMCSNASPGCIAACLNTAGNPVYLEAKLEARIQRTLAFMKCRQAYLALMAFELESLEKKAAKLKMLPAWRPNTTSDYPFHSLAITVNGKPVKSLIHHFSKIQAYDYTKVAKKALQAAAGLLPENYHITFSKSEVNDSDVLRVLQAGGNVAVVFSGKILPKMYNGFPVINGDVTDYRPNDASNVIVGLKAKGKAKADQSGFVVQQHILQEA